jgi:hypothetical protein
MLSQTAQFAATPPFRVGGGCFNEEESCDHRRRDRLVKEIYDPVTLLLSTCDSTLLDLSRRRVSHLKHHVTDFAVGSDKIPRCGIGSESAPRGGGDIFDCLPLSLMSEWKPHATHFALC